MQDLEFMFNLHCTLFANIYLSSERLEILDYIGDLPQTEYAGPSLFQLQIYVSFTLYYSH